MREQLHPEIYLELDAFLLAKERNFCIPIVVDFSMKDNEEAKARKQGDNYVALVTSDTIHNITHQIVQLMSDNNNLSKEIENMRNAATTTTTAKKKMPLKKKKVSAKKLAGAAVKARVSKAKTAIKKSAVTRAKRAN